MNQAQVVHPIFAPVAHQPNAVGDRVMSRLLPLPDRNSAPEVQRERERPGW
jgi:hypothetical protein